MSGPIKHTARLPYGYRVEFSWADGGMSVEWEPATPRIHSARHRRKFMAAYAAERRQFVESLATVINGSVLVADLDGRAELVLPATKN